MDAEVNPTQILRDHKAKISDVPPSHTLFVQKRVDGYYTPVNYCNSVFVTKVADSRSQHTDSLVNITKKGSIEIDGFRLFCKKKLWAIQKADGRTNALRATVYHKIYLRVLPPIPKQSKKCLITSKLS